MTRTTRAAAALFLSACASAQAPAPQPAAPSTTLAYSVSAPATATYGFRDSTSAAIQGGPIGNIEINTSATATAEITYTPQGAQTEATIRVTDFEGALVNSATASRATATEADISGPAVFTVSARGATTNARLPTLSPTVLRAGMNASFFRWFFVTLPPGSVRPGAVWVDTLRTSDDAGGTVASVDIIVTSTFARDTVVGGRTLAVINTTSQRAVNISGTSEGIQIAQKLTGSGTGRVLWDVERGMPVERSESFQLSGTFELPQMGVSGLPITARSGVKLELK